MIIDHYIKIQILRHREYYYTRKLTGVYTATVLTDSLQKCLWLNKLSNNRLFYYPKITKPNFLPLFISCKEETT